MGQEFSIIFTTLRDQGHSGLHLKTNHLTFISLSPLPPVSEFEISEKVSKSVEKYIAELWGCQRQGMGHLGTDQLRAHSKEEKCMWGDAQW